MRARSRAAKSRVFAGRTQSSWPPSVHSQATVKVIARIWGRPGSGETSIYEPSPGKLVLKDAQNELGLKGQVGSRTMDPSTQPLCVWRRSNVCHRSAYDGT